MSKKKKEEKKTCVDVVFPPTPTAPHTHPLSPLHADIRLILEGKTEGKDEGEERESMLCVL